jgi:hypothetical protein
MFIRKKKVTSGDGYKWYYYIEECQKLGSNKYKMKTLKYIGTAETLLEKLNELERLKAKR